MIVNGLNYSWGNIEITTTLTGTLPLQLVQEIEYSDKQNIENTYGAGNFPVGQGQGMVKYEGSITLYKETILLLQSISPTGRLQDLGAFTASVSMGNTSQAFITETLQSVWFLENALNAKVDDTRLTYKIPLVIGNINWAQ